MTSSPLPSLLVIPTGIGCEIGGYAGDAIPFARLLAAASGCLITHPNVMNGASLFWDDKRIQYVEGFALDQFACGELMLSPVRKQKVGVLFDAGLEEELHQRHIHVVDACRATLGIDIGPVVATESPLEMRFKTSSSGASTGEIINPRLLVKAGERLKDEGATAIAVVTRFPDDIESNSLEAYRKGRGVDVIAGAEALISHLLVRHLCLPCAHAPAMFPLPIDECLDPRAAAEEIGYTFLSSVLVGLSRAPNLIPKSDDIEKMNLGLNLPLIGVEQVGAIIAPQGALGGEAVLACIARRIPLIVVANSGILSVGLDALGLSSDLQLKKNMPIFSVKNYLEAASIVLALREGLSIDSLMRPIKKVTVSK
ncbi:DUF3326 domain-containing protein [Prochlorococcus marinus]|uniref:DUF3326 domain-containing protein n=1 Tax=Prochlorococcus marinus TaxID=1219 RepID=UPI0022B5E403|nr:DUF3326 domain-containing protein [Prochlorococcus marinus]